MIWRPFTTDTQQRYGETGRRHPAENEAIWQGLNSMLEQGHVRPAIYKRYLGLDSVPRALHELSARKVWGKALIDLAYQQLLQSKM